MRLTGNAWSELGLAPAADRRREIALVAIVVTAVISASLVSSLGDRASYQSGQTSSAASGEAAAKKSDASLVMQRGIAKHMKEDWKNRTMRALTPTAQAVSLSTRVSAPPDPVPTSGAQAEREPRRSHRLARRPHTGFWRRSWERSAGTALLSRGSISSEH